MREAVEGGSLLRISAARLRREIDKALSAAPLSKVAGIMQRHGGRIDVESHVDVGSNFRMTWPRKPPPGARTKSNELRDTLVGTRAFEPEDPGVDESAPSGATTPLRPRIQKHGNGGKTS